MAKFASTLGPLNVPQSRRGVATYDASVVGSGMLRAAQDIKSSTNDLARGIRVAANEVDQVQQEDDRRYAQQLDNEFAKKITEVQYGDGTEANPGYYNLKGEAAVQGYSGQEAKIEKIKQELLTKAQNRRVKDMFSLAADQRQNTEIEGMRKHVGSARVEAADAVTATRQKQAENDAALAPGNQVILDRSIAIAERGAIEYGKRHGQSKEEIALNAAGMRSNVLIAAINAAIPVDPDGADAIYQRNKDKIDPQARAKIEGVLLEQTLAAQGQAIAEEAQAKGGKTMASQLQYIRDHYSGKKEEQAVAELKERYAEVNYEKDQAYQATQRARSQIQWEWATAEHEDKLARDGAKKDAWASVTDPKNPMSLSDWAAANPDKFNALDPYDWGKLQSAETNFLTQQEYGDMTDPKFLDDLHKMDPGDLVQKDLYLEKKKFKNQADYEKALNMQKAAEDRINRESNNASTYRRMEYMLKDYAPKDDKGKLAISDAELNAAQNAMAADVYAYIQQKGEAPDDKWLREQANKYMTPVWRYRSTWFDKAQGVIGSLSELPQDDANQAYVPLDKIPDPQKADIMADLKAHGLDPEDDIMIGKLYLAILTKDGKRYNSLLGIQNDKE